jgi:hypothetical protein
MTRIAMHALYRRFLRVGVPVMLLLVAGLNAVSILRAWRGTLFQWSSELVFIGMICLIATDLMVLVFQKNRPWRPRLIFVWRRILSRVVIGAIAALLSVYGGWLGRAAAVEMTALFAFIWLRTRH